MTEQAPATRRTATKKTPAKKPSAAELARREAQSKEDTATVDDLEVIVDGITVTVTPDAVDDYDAIDALDQGDPRLMMKLLFPDEAEQKAAYDALREEGGKLRLSRTYQFVTNVFEAVQAGKS